MISMRQVTHTVLSLAKGLGASPRYIAAYEDAVYRDNPEYKQVRRPRPSEVLDSVSSLGCLPGQCPDRAKGEA